MHGSPLVVFTAGGDLRRPEELFGECSGKANDTPVCASVATVWLMVNAPVTRGWVPTRATTGPSYRIPGLPTRTGTGSRTSSRTRPMVQTMFAAIPRFGSSSGWCRRCRSLNVTKSDGTPAR